jgi:hypothetical protein
MKYNMLIPECFHTAEHGLFFVIWRLLFLLRRELWLKFPGDAVLPRDTCFSCAIAVIFSV